MSTTPHDDGILIIDFGSQYTQLIARRLRELGVFSYLMPHHASEASFAAYRPKGVILSGGPESVSDTQGPPIPDIVWSWGCPVLGICYGMQAMAAHFGGQVDNHPQGEFGDTTLSVHPQSWLGEALGDEHLTVWMSHCDQVTACPNNFEIMASSKTCPIAAMVHRTQPYLGLQFHPEVDHTEKGMAILKQFAVSMCQAATSWTAAHILLEQVEAIKAQVGEDQVIVGLSGGVDSAVVAALLHRALSPDQVICLFVDHGLLRQGEAEQVLHDFSQLGIDVQCIQAQNRFFQALQGLEDPEAKRTCIGHTFVDVFQEEAERYPQARWLAQGTIYPDVIESAGVTHGAHVIKSHHNVGGLPERLHLKLVEPLRQLFKDEVRQVGLALGLPKRLIQRHPFPGPGLAVRVLGEVTPKNVAICQAADAIFLEVLSKHNMLSQVNQAFAVFLPIKSVGVVGDMRRYAHVVALRAVTTQDFMTARFSELPHALLNEAATRILNEVPEVARVVYDISNKPAATIEWE